MFIFIFDMYHSLRYHSPHGFYLNSGENNFLSVITSTLPSIMELE